jgi:hypothetical protein
VFVRFVIVGVFALSLLVGSSHAAEKLHQIKIIGSGNHVEFDSLTIPPEMQSGYLSMKIYCLGCHGQERMITTLRTGVSPVTKQPYGEVEFHDKIIKIMRGSHADLDRDHAKTLAEFFHFLSKKAHIN